MKVETLTPEQLAALGLVVLVVAVVGIVTATVTLVADLRRRRRYRLTSERLNGIRTGAIDVFQ